MNKKIKKILKKLRHSWITVWLIAAAIALSCVVGYAVYTGVSSVKRVVSTGAGTGLLFSSDYMTTGTLITTEHGDYSAYTGNQQPLYPFVVSNHPQGDKHVWYTANNIEYRLQAKLVKNEKYTSSDPETTSNPSLIGQYKPITASDIQGKTFQIGIKGDTKRSFVVGETITYNFTNDNSLKKVEPDDDTFELVIDKSELLNDEPTVLVELTAIPSNISGGEVERLFGYIGICKRTAGDAKWIGRINDENYTSIDYDAYNYVFSGNGTGTFYFAYDSTKVAPNEFFLQNNGGENGIIVDGFNNVALTDADWGKLTKYKTTTPTNKSDWRIIAFSVDSTKMPRYNLQLYKKSGGNYSSVIDNYVDYGFAAQNSSNN